MVTGSPVVDMKMTAWYLARLASVNWALSSVVSTAKLFSWPSFWTAAIPSGIESCRKPLVLEKTRTLKAGSAAFADDAWVVEAFAGDARSVKAGIRGTTRARATVVAVRRRKRFSVFGRIVENLAHVRERGDMGDSFPDWGVSGKARAAALVPLVT
ncbi:hypothetical protein GCM10018952_41510 [Streptosporangium vulgare]